MQFIIGGIVAVAVLLAAGGVAYGKKHARRLQHERRIRIDRFKLKRRHAEIELEVFGSREVVQAVQAYAREHHVPIEQARRQARTYLREIVPGPAVNSAMAVRVHAVARSSRTTRTGP